MVATTSSRYIVHVSAAHMLLVDVLSMEWSSCRMVSITVSTPTIDADTTVLTTTGYCWILLVCVLVVCMQSVVVYSSYYMLYEQYVGSC